MDLDFLYKEYQRCSGISIDSRKINFNEIFVALSGEHTDGNQYAIAAINQGARLAIVTDKNVSNLHSKCFLVDDSLIALQELAKYHRRQLTIPIIGITGSVAKTTSKELISVVLRSKFNVYSTKGNLNNHIGVPLSILAINAEHEMAVIEMGANHIGEIEELCAICEPTHGIITRIGQAHLEGFGSIEGVLIAKSDLYRWLRNHKGTAFINDNDRYLMAIEKGFDMKKIFIHQIVKSSIITSDPFLDILCTIDSLSTIHIQTQIPGDFNLENIEASICIGHYFKVEPEQIKQSIESYIPGANRSQLKAVGANTFIMDAYNANPLSMSEAIKSFAKSGYINKGLIIGEMREMGIHKDKVHYEILELVENNRASWQLVCVVGEAFIAFKNKYQDIYFFETVNELKEWFDAKSFKEFTFLLKASRGIALEKLVI